MSDTVQKNAVLRHMMFKGPITAMIALEDYKCFRLAARIFELKQEGHDVNREMVKLDNGKYIAEYSLKKFKERRGDSNAAQLEVNER